MVRQLWSIASTEALMARRTWRFWLTLVLLLGILYLTWKDHVAFVEADMYLAPDHSFGNRPYYESRNRNRPWDQRAVQNYAASLSLAITLVGGVALALDSCGRLRRTGIDKILFPRPFSTVCFVLGRYLGILLITVPLSAIPWVGFGLLQSYYGHADVVWQPFILCYLFVVLPVLLPLVALALWLRLVFKHDVVAIFVLLFFLVIYRFFFSYFLMALGIRNQLLLNWQALNESSPSLGAGLDLADQGPVILVFVLLTVLFLLLAPFHLRRQEPQRRLLRRRGYRWFSIPTFLRWLSDLKMDRNLPLVLKSAAFLFVVLVGGGGVFAVLEGRNQLQETKTDAKALAHIERHPHPATPYDVLSYDIEVSIDFTRDEITSASTVHLQSATDNLAVARFFLNRGLKIRELTGPRGPLQYKADFHVLSVTLPRPLHIGEPLEFHLKADGVLNSHYSRTGKNLHPNFGRLRRNEWWYPVQYTPWVFVKEQGRSRTVSMGRPDLFDATVSLTLPTGSETVFPGEEIAREELGAFHKNTYRTPHPVSEIQLLWGRYSYVDAEFAGIPCRFFHLPGHRYQAQVFLEEMKDSQTAVREKLGALPFPRLTVYEAPMHSHIWYEQEMAGLLSVNEDHLVYLHEGIWSLDRYDVKPSEVDFYQRLEGIVGELGWHYRGFLVTTYFDKTFHATGPYAFWLDKYLSSYIGKLLEPNAWRRRYLFNYDAGSRPNTVGRALARPLLELRNEQPESDAERLRGEGMFRMLHHLLDDDGWWTFVRRLLEEYRFKDVSDQDVVRLANGVSDEPLDWFFEQWLYGDVLPKYEITLAEATVVRKPRSIQLEYEVRVKVKNHETGRMAVPIYVETERDHILRNLWLDAGQEYTLTMVVPHRPTFAMVDPENWILQEPHFNEKNKSTAHSERKFDVYQPHEREERGESVATLDDRSKNQ